MNKAVLLITFLFMIFLISGCVQTDKQTSDDQADTQTPNQTENITDFRNDTLEGAGGQGEPEEEDFNPVGFVKSKIIDEYRGDGWYSGEWKSEMSDEGKWKVFVGGDKAVWIVKPDGYICADNDDAETFSKVGLCDGVSIGGTTTISYQSLSGEFNENQIWSGEITITGDTAIEGDLTILPGTVIKFKVQDDENAGEEVEADGYNDHDPTRLDEYEKTHSVLAVMGRLMAKGTPDERILFTSDSEEPYYADWISVNVEKDGSLVEYCILEWSRNGISLGGDKQPNTIIRNNIINHSFWTGVCTDDSGGQVYNNEIWDAGHEGVDVQNGDPVIENNIIHTCHTGIVVLKGSPKIKNNTMINVGNGIHVTSEASPVLENNHVELAPHDSTKEWRYDNFAYKMFGDAVVY